MSTHKKSMLILKPNKNG